MFGIALLSSALLALADARIYERCELARDLLSFGVKREHLATWVCIAFHESRFDTAARNPSSGDHGILQISELYWCGAGKACGLPCSALRDEDISDDVECALRIHEEHTRLQGNGFLAWVVYPHHCKHNAKKYLADCESSVKTPLVRTEGRARVFKPQDRNVTTFTKYPKIDQLLPPYLTIGSLFRGNYETEFEQNYNKKMKIDWLNYKIDNIDELKLPVLNQNSKIDNIDELKLPVLNQNVIGEYTRTPLVTTTTTTTISPLPNIKPPSPRRIESNSFRRKKVRIFEPVKFIDTTDSPKMVLSTPKQRNAYYPPTESVSTFDILDKFKIKGNIPITTTLKPSTKDLVSSLTSAALVHKTTSSPIIYPINSVLTTNTQRVSTEITERSSSSSTLSIGPYTTRSHSDFLNNRTIEHTPTLTSTTKAPTDIKTDSFRFGKSQASSTTPTTTITAVTSRPWSNSWLNWRTTSKYTITTSTPKPPPTTPRTISTSPNAASQIKEFITVKESNPQSTTTTSTTRTTTTTTSRPWSNSWLNWRTTSKYTTTPSTPKPLSTTHRTINTSSTTTTPTAKIITTTPRPWSNSWLNWRTTSKSTTTTSTTKPSVTTRRVDNTSLIPARLLIKEQGHQSTTPKSWSKPRSWFDFKAPTNLQLQQTSKTSVEPTTSKTPSTTPKFSLRSSIAPTVRSITSKSTFTALPSPTTSSSTVRSTQSIFDLYLNPTTRPPISLSPFKNSGLSLRIFSGGTTTQAPSISKNDTAKVSSKFEKLKIAT